MEKTVMMKIGAIPSSFRVPFKEAVIRTKEIGIQGIQPMVRLKDEINPTLSKDERKAVLKYIKDNGLDISAVCGDFGSVYFSQKAGENDDSVKLMMSMMDLAVDLGTNIITTHIGQVPEDENCEKYANIVNTIERLGKYGEQIGVMFATETGPEMAIKLKGILDKANTKNAKVNLDPANFVMCAGQDPVEAVYILKDYIVHTHAKDGLKTYDGTNGERPLGQGVVPFHKYLTALKDIGYDGFLTIEREVGENPTADIKLAHDYLVECLKKIY